MFWSQSRSNLRMELNELKHAHSLELARKEQAYFLELGKREAEFFIQKEAWEKGKELLIKELTQNSELKLKETVTLLKLDNEQRVKQAELTAQREINQATARLNDEHYAKLKDSMTRLHEEGNFQTKFVQEAALKLMAASPTHKTETRVVTSGEPKA